MSHEARPRSRILTSVVFLLFAAGALPLLLFGTRLTSFNRERLEVQQKEQQLAIAEAVAREVAEFVRAEKAGVLGLAGGLELSLALHEPAQALAELRDGALLNRFLEQDPDLVKLMFAARTPAEGQDVRRLEFVQASRTDDPRLGPAADELLLAALERAFRGSVALESSPGLSALGYAVPVRRSGRIAGVLAAIVSLDALQERIEARSQRLYTVFLTDAGGQHLLAHSQRQPVIDELATPLVAAFRDGGGTRTMPFTTGERGAEQEWLGAFATVPETGWGSFVEIDADSAYYAVGQMRRTTLLWSAASVLLGLVLGTLFAQRLVHPIRELARGAQRLARGDFSAPIRLRSRNELGLLAHSFNHMADEIRDKIAALESAARENKELFLASIRMLAEAIDEKDPYTRGHSERVTRYAVATAHAFGLAGDEVERVQIGALLHDVGKIGIDDRILRKPSVLTDEEFEIMKQHPEKGAHIMGAVRQLADIIPGMRFHHEKVDGTGYPLGLKGDAIPVAAQIISVADTFDAMTTDRPYQKGMDPDFVVGKLNGWIGTRFRRDVVEAFERAFRAGDIEVRARKATAAPAVAVARGT